MTMVMTIVIYAGLTMRVLSLCGTGAFTDVAHKGRQYRLENQTKMVYFGPIGSL